MKNIKSLLALILALVLVLSLAACGGKSGDNSGADADTSDANNTTDTAEDGGASDVADNAQEGRTFTVGFDAEFPPYGYMDDNGEYIGFDLDLAEAVCNYYGWTLVKQPINWDSKDMELNGGTIDCIWNGFTMTGRESEYTWTDPYIDNSQVIVVRADSGITTFADLAGKTVDVQADSSALAALTDEEDNADNLALAASFASLQQVGDYNTAFLDLESKAVDAIAMDVGVANYEIASRGEGYVILEQELSTEQYAVGFKLGNTELRDQVQTALEALVADGTVDTILNKWADQVSADSFCFGK
ncbi:MAG: amino acid ABC transporter substrate-binding protein [Oscillospiraceae bacterium]|nr:amino acid ABC transporter substrate-binding protein [Oscillospiraceae bacterium]